MQGQLGPFHHPPPSPHLRAVSVADVTRERPAAPPLTPPAIEKRHSQSPTLAPPHHVRQGAAVKCHHRHGRGTPVWLKPQAAEPSQRRHADGGPAEPLDCHPRRHLTGRLGVSSALVVVPGKRHGKKRQPSTRPESQCRCVSVFSPKQSRASLFSDSLGPPPRRASTRVACPRTAS